MADPNPYDAGQPSTTARVVAAYRKSFERRTFPRGDPGADDRLARDIAGDLTVDLSAPMGRYLAARTKAFDAAVVSGLERGVRQIVVIGAGYDGRSLRYASTGVRWFEVDHHATQEDKRARWQRLGVDAAEVTFVSSDLRDGTLASDVVAAGFDPEIPALLLCEGVLVYLSPQVARETLAQCRELAAPGTRLALSARTRSADPTRRAAFDATVAAAGEPALFGSASVEDLLEQTRWQLLDLSAGASRIGFRVAIPV